ncbi:hypothetical protein D039_0924B, partial [Vibrio parahaemolyticus EKP-028]
GPIDILNGY